LNEKHFRYDETENPSIYGYLALLTALSVIFSFIITSCTPFVSTIRVPQDYESVTEAVKASDKGTIVEVSPGSFSENVKISDMQNLTLTSTAPEDSQVVKDTSIEAHDENKPTSKKPSTILRR